MRKNARRVVTLLFIAVGPIFTACEAVLDFDRSPLQPLYEAGVDDSSASSSTPDAKPDSPAGEAGSEGGGTPVDAGSDSAKLDAAGDG